MALKQEQEKLQSVLTEAIKALCKSGLQYHTELSVEGLLGVTVDRQQVFLVPIKELIQPYMGSSARKRKRRTIVFDDGDPPTKVSDKQNLIPNLSLHFSSQTEDMSNQNAEIMTHMIEPVVPDATVGTSVKYSNEIDGTSVTQTVGSTSGATDYSSDTEDHRNTIVDMPVSEDSGESVGMTEHSNICNVKEETFTNSIPLVNIKQELCDDSLDSTLNSYPYSQTSSQTFGDFHNNDNTHLLSPQTMQLGSLVTSMPVSTSPAWTVPSGGVCETGGPVPVGDPVPTSFLKSPQVSMRITEINQLQLSL